MRIVFLAESKSVHSHRWIRFFAERGHRIDWVSLSDGSGMTPPAGVRFHAVTSPRPLPLRVLRAARIVRRLVKEGDVDVVHAHYAGTYGLIGALAGFSPLVLTVWGSDVLLAGRSRIYGPLVRGIVRRADLVTCDAEHLRDAVIRLGAAPDRIRIVYFGTDTEVNHPRRASTVLREQLGRGATAIVISARTLHPLYDVATLVRAIPEVLRDYPAVRVVIAGDGPQRGELERLADELGVAAVTTFVGALAPQLLPEYLATASVYVSTSTSDGGLASTTAEAMACGTPVVITDFGQNRDWVDDGHSGLIVPIGDHHALAAAITRLLVEPALRQRLGAAGRAVIEERNSYQREMGRMEQLYQSLLTSPRTGVASVRVP